MASYWRALYLAGVVSLIVGGFGYVQNLHSVGMMPPTAVARITAVLAAVSTFCAVTTLQAIWYLIRRQKGTAGRLLITAGTPPALLWGVIVVDSLFFVLTGHPPLGIFTPNASTPVLDLLFAIAWIVVGILLIRLDRRQRLSESQLIPETGSTENGKWPPLPLGKKQ